MAQKASDTKSKPAPAAPAVPAAPAAAGDQVLDKVKAVIEKEIAPALAYDGGSIALVGVTDGVVKVRLAGACGCCPMSQMTLINFVERTLKQKVPGVKRVEA